MDFASKLRGLDASGMEATDEQETPLFAAGSAEEAECHGLMQQALDPPVRERSSVALQLMCLRGTRESDHAFSSACTVFASQPSLVWASPCSLDEHEHAFVRLTLLS